MMQNNICLGFFYQFIFKIYINKFLVKFLFRIMNYNNEKMVSAALKKKVVVAKHKCERPRKICRLD